MASYRKRRFRNRYKKGKKKGYRKSGKTSRRPSGGFIPSTSKNLIYHPPNHSIPYPRLGEVRFRDPYGRLLFPGQLPPPIT